MVGLDGDRRQRGQVRRYVRRRQRAVLGMLAVAAGVLAGCAAPTTSPGPQAAVVAAGPAATTVIDTDDATVLAVATSAALYSSAPVVVVAGSDDAGAQATAAPVAERLGVPLLLVPAEGDPAPVTAELSRLTARTVLTVGDAASRWAETADLSAEVVTDETALPAVTAPAPAPAVLVLAQDSAGQRAATATARASGARVEVVSGADPRVGLPTLDNPPDRVLALGPAFGEPAVLDRRLAVAATGVELPGGGQVVFPGRRMVALYGHPGAPALGVLGEQGVAASVTRAKELAAQYQPLVDEPIVPAFEMITTVANAVPGTDGDYSAESAVEDLQPWVDAAGKAGVYVLLDLQPGRTDFLTQAKRYEELLAEPHVGLALDPEWRLLPTQRHLEQIGSVKVDEVNDVVTWLADLTRDRVLPQKVLMLHQFRVSMIAGRERLDTSRDELSVVLHVDGFGAPDTKLQTWNALRQGPPDGVEWGWKNFYDEDTPTFTPAQTVRIDPAPPVFVSYQ